ncbi:hypothetical protein TrVE_jg6356 [Triparma verrucosa]|uniref:RING-type domain-containing protein n=1 Tax=Triparma verrucosa TaxID=1606542 RepID=A0A9W7B7I6_9STRA|nr:hypothetical protein TrVE_jg6356 [Triparma verrucosa]
MGNLLSSTIRSLALPHTQLTPEQISESVESTNEKLSSLVGIINEHSEELSTIITEASAFIPQIPPAESNEKFVPLSTTITLSCGVRSISLNLSTYLRLSKLLSSLQAVLSNGHLLTSLPKINLTSDLTSSERIREYLKRKNDLKHDMECIICLESTTEVACENCGTGVCVNCQRQWEEENTGGGCVVCREKGEGWNIAEYGEGEMREGVRENVEEIERVILGAI